MESGALRRKIFILWLSLSSVMIKNLKDIKREGVKLFGGKATNLGFLIQNGFNVPEGFCISTKVKKLTKDIKENIMQKYKELNSPVSVRSSATSEDARNASFAGQFETFLNVNSENELLNSINKCWKSAKSRRVISYARKNRIKNIKMAVIVQKMINPDFAGVIFTVDPVHNKDILIESVKGLGEKLVSGKVTPSSYLIDRKNYKINNKSGNFNMNKILIQELARISLRIEKSYNFPQDIEFATKDDEIFILQSRAITTINQSENSIVQEDTENEINEIIKRDKNTKWFLYVTRPNPVLYRWMVNIAEGQKKIMKEATGLDFYCYDKKVIFGNLMMSQDDLERIKKIIIKDNKNKPEIFTNLSKKCLDRCKELINFCNSIKYADFKKNTNKELWEIFSKYVQKQSMAMTFLALATILDNIMEEKIISYIQRKNLPNEVASKLVFPLVMSTPAKERSSLLKLALMLEKNPNYNYKTEFNGIHEKFCWSSNLYWWGDNKNYDYYNKKLKQLQKTNIIKELIILKNDIANNKKEFELIIKKYNLDKDFVSYCRVAQYWAFLRTYRIEATYEGNYLIQNLRKEISKRMSLKEEKDFYQLTLPEIQSFLLNNLNVDYLKINERKRGYILFFFDENNFLFSLKYIGKFMQKEKDIMEVREITGNIVYMGKVEGRAKIVKKASELSKLKKGDILITPMTTIDYVPYLDKASAIVTDEGGIACHAAIVAREFKIPAIVGTKFATKILKDNDLIEVDARKGIVRKLK